MTVEQKLETLYNAVNEAWTHAFEGWEWERNEENPKQFMLGEKTEEKDMAPEGFKTVEVKTGISNDDFIEIVSGLSEGDVVYAISTNGLQQNQMFPAMGGMSGGMRGGMGSAPSGAMSGHPGSIGRQSGGMGGR